MEINDVEARLPVGNAVGHLTAVAAIDDPAARPEVVVVCFFDIVGDDAVTGAGSEPGLGLDDDRLEWSTVTISPKDDFARVAGCRRAEGAGVGVGGGGDVVGLVLDKAVEITREGGDTDIGAGVEELCGEVASLPGAKESFLRQSVPLVSSPNA